jgi:CelD/BcsL family acetyltransferase involved in cellulose biosynthesis
MATLDVQVPILAENPPGWPEVPARLRRALAAGDGMLWHLPGCAARMEGPFIRRGACAPGCPVADFNALLAGRWFLIRNDASAGYRPRCGRCNQVHDFLTLGCVERPFNGLTEIVAMLRDFRAEGRDRVMEGVRYGALVPITAAEAQRLAGRIRAKGEVL